MPMKNPKREGLTAAEVAKICGVCERTVKAWADPKKGEAFKRNKRGGRYYWDPERLVMWLIEQGKHAESSRMDGFVRHRRAQKSKKKPRSEVITEVDTYEKTQKTNAREVNKQFKKRVKTGNVPTDDGDAQAAGPPPAALPGDPEKLTLFDVKTKTKVLYLLAIERLKSATAGNVHTEFKNVLAIGDAVRKFELDCLEVDKALGKVIPVATAEKFIGKIMVRVRTDMQGLRTKLKDDLAAMDDANEIDKLLARSIDDALRHLARGLQHADDL